VLAPFCVDRVSVDAAVAAVRFSGIDVCAISPVASAWGNRARDISVWDTPCSISMHIGDQSTDACSRAGKCSPWARKIVNIGAVAGLAAKRIWAAYSAAKSAVIRLTESMSAELRDKGINVNCVLPSRFIDTPQNRADMPGADPRALGGAEALG